MTVTSLGMQKCVLLALPLRKKWAAAVPRPGAVGDLNDVPFYHKTWEGLYFVLRIILKFVGSFSLVRHIAISFKRKAHRLALLLQPSVVQPYHI